LVVVHVETRAEGVLDADKYATVTGIGPEFTGVSDPYEAPQRPDLRLDGAQEDPTLLASQVIKELARRLLIV
jgi:adenylylsulfate kinase-like enzyme